MKSLILGSASPRRKQIIRFLGVDFRIHPSNFDESLVEFDGSPKDYVLELASRKLQTLIANFPSETILTADTVVFHKNEVFEKPCSIDHAREMLLKLQGTKHYVMTAVAVYKEGKTLTDFASTEIELIPLSKKDIDAYFEKVNPLDKAGAYAIQDEGCVIVKEIKGCYYNVVGLPIQTTKNLLNAIGYLV